MKKIMKKNQVIITSLAILIAVAGYPNFADVDLGFKDQEASTDSSSILEETEYDITDETALLDARIRQMALRSLKQQVLQGSRTYRCYRFCRSGNTFKESRYVPRIRQIFRKS